MTAREKHTRKKHPWSRINALNTELYGSAYRMALKRFSVSQKQERPNLVLWLHDFIRHEITKGTTDPSVIAAKALEALEKH